MPCNASTGCRWSEGLVEQMLRAPLLKLIEVLLPGGADFLERLVGLDGVQRRLVLEQMRHFSGAELQRIEPVKRFGQQQANVHHVAMVAVREENADAAAQFVFVDAGLGRELDGDETHTRQS